MEEADIPEEHRGLATHRRREKITAKENFRASVSGGPGNKGCIKQTGSWPLGLLRSFSGLLL